MHQSNIGSKLDPLCWLHGGRAEGSWKGLGHSCGQVSSSSSVQNRGIASKKSLADAFPDGLNSCIMSGNVVGREGWAACQDVARTVLVASAYGAAVSVGRVRGGGVWHFPPVSKLLVPESPPAGLEYLHLKGPGDSGGGPEMVASKGEDMGEGLEPEISVNPCQTGLGSMKGEGKVQFDIST